MDEIIHYLEVYHKVTHLSVFAIDFTGEVTCAVGDAPDFCQYFQSLTGVNCPCKQAHLHAGRQSEKIGEPYIYFCPSGLVHWTVPIVFDGTLSGALVSGMIQMSIVDHYTIDRLVKAYQLPNSCHDELEQYFNDICTIPPEQVRYLAEMLNIIARDISRDQAHLLDERKRFYQEQRLLGEQVQAIKSQESMTNISSLYPVDSERELINRVKCGDKTGAKTLLNDILGYIFFQYAGNLEMMIARGLELLVIISRAAIEGGADPQEIFQLTQTYTIQIPKVHSVNQLSFLIIKVLDQFTDTVFPVEHIENTAVIKTAISYINQHSNEHITLSSVANHVYLSPTYFSRLFKYETGMTFSSYVNYVRVEESKKYLLDLDYSLSDIATMVGFSDQSYFTKIFKRFENISPGQYRRNR